MQIIRNQVSIAAQAGALDGSLAFSSIYTQHQDLIAQTAISGLRGLESILSETGIYGQAMRAMQDVASKITEANELAHRDPFTIASGSLSSQHNTATVNGLRTQGQQFISPTSSAVNTAQSAVNGTDSTKPERGYANTVLNAANVLSSLGVGYLINQGDPATSTHWANTTRNDAISARGSAQTLLGQLQSQTPLPTARITATQNVINAANSVINAADSILSFNSNNPIALIRSETPTIHNIGGGYSLATWGDSGYTTLTDSAGQGVIISPDGTVDPLDGAGQGWKFNTTSTFVLPGETKITFNPGNPANMLVSRGIHAFTLENVGSNRNPNMSDYQSLNGRVVDRTSNDGYIININGNAANWTLGGSVLGDAGSREVVATSFLTNELKLDPTDVAVSPDTTTTLTAIGIIGHDYDGDGKHNNEELAAISGEVANYIRQLQDQYEQALAQLKAANDALKELNDLLELLRKQNDKNIENQAGDDASLKSELKAVERKLLDALNTLNGTGTPQQPTALSGGIEGGAQQILQQLSSINQQGGLQSTLATSSSPTLPPTTSPSSSSSGTQDNLETLGQPVNTNGTDPLGDSLRRASKLLSGMLGGGNLNILELPPGPGPGGTEPNTLVDPTGQTDLGVALPILEDLGLSLATLVTDLNVQLGLTPSVPLTPPDLSAGVEGLLKALANAGLIDDSLLLNAENSGDLLQSILTSIGASARTGEGSEPAAASLLSFLGTLAQFGSALKAVAPQTAQTTPDELEKPSTASLTPLSVAAQKVADILLGSDPDAQRQIAEGVMRNEEHFKDIARATEQLKLVLQGLADIGTAGSGQSLKNANAEPPTNAELSKGLQMFISALLTFGLFSNSEQQQDTSNTETQSSTITFGSDNRNAINTITGNFATDPELLKIIEANLNKALQVQQQQLHQASALFQESQQIVQKFVEIVKTDSLVQDVVKSDDLSDEQQSLFDERMKELQKDWGIDWGGTGGTSTPTTQSNLTTRAVQSGLMV